MDSEAHRIQNVLRIWDWTRIELPFERHSEYIYQWCDDNCTTGEWTKFGPIYWFEKEQDAIMFSLRWL